ncbi:WD40 repeat-like protein [Punctularia strigosozonata HHB-11173 SS5]|uniref:WD40 repeat-like protein n=1 Tax=Punctularia strigosozonata (strain HHB-11173) TaxID=741275 RepID=UPI0004416E2E|nr:WD40 repeat-like protein [Punctularia strigosozonata HHB-11173 SS5]EIN12156.1 WD40 repeat-like protein [Punctularia strigosozonata HHB-11173 SS5]
MAVRKTFRKIRNRVAHRAGPGNPMNDPASPASSSSGIGVSSATNAPVQHEGPAVGTDINEQTKDNIMSRGDQKDNRYSVVAGPVGKPSSDMATAQQAIEGAKEDFSAMRSIGLAEGGAASAKNWGPLFSRVKLFTELVDSIAEVHPYAKIAWSILSTVQKTVISQVEIDQSVRDLLDTIEAVYEFMDQAQPVSCVIPAAKLLTALAQQTTECGYFIRDYAKNKNFVRRTASNALKSLVHPAEAAPKLVRDYQDKFAELKEQLLDGSTIRTEIAVQEVNLVLRRVLNTVEETAVDVQMMRLYDACARGSRFNSEKRCLPGTRQTILQNIVDWINDPLDPRRMFLLSGPAGSGKSAIAHTIAALFHEIRCLGSSYCFDRSKAELTRTSPFFPTIARDLSEWDPEMKLTLSNAIAQDSALVTSDDVVGQFRRLIVGPMKQLAMSGPIVIVIDALDECDSSARSSLLSVLQSQKEEDVLPSNVRVLITCRPEQDITDALRHAPHVRIHSMSDVLDAPTNEEDIRLYARDRLSTVFSAPEDLGMISAQVVRSAEGLFQWAATACRILVARKPPRSIQQRIAIVFPPAGQRPTKGHLDELYLQVLAFTFPPTDADVIENFRRVMSPLLTAIEPLSISSLQDILYGQDPDIINEVLAGMGSLLSGTDGSARDAVVRPLHTSFRDFILDPQRSQEFAIGPGVDEHRDFARGTLGLLLSSRLHFNMCKLETSYRLNADIPGLGERVRANIPPSLVYSARYWADHLEKTAYDPDLQEMTEQLLKEKFLFWVEVLSLIESMVTCASALGKLKEWIPKACHFYDVVAGLEMDSIIQDFLRFIRAFGMTIGASAPHLYLSAVPFAPARSRIWKDLAVVGLEGGTILVYEVTTGQTIRTFKGHTDYVSSVAFSPDGKRVVSGSDDETVCIWDVQSEQLVHPPLQGHTNHVTSVAFSPDSHWVASGSLDGTICLWNTTTGQLVCEPLRGHSNAVFSVMFSHDGECIVSGSYDETVRLWDTTSGQSLGSPFEGPSRCVICVAISPDKRFIASGSSVGVIHLWDATERTLCATFRGHVEKLTSLAFSKDGQHIVSGSVDRTVRVWDVSGRRTDMGIAGSHPEWLGEMAVSLDGKSIVTWCNEDITVWDVSTGTAAVQGRRWRGHERQIFYMGFFPDGCRVLSCSYDDTVRMWEVSTGQLIHQFRVPNEEDMSVIGWCCAVISPDGRFVAMARSEQIRIWDISTGTLVHTLQGHTGETCALAFSPDGQHMASGAVDGTLRLWDFATGQPAGAPLEGHARSVNIAFAPDGAYLVSGDSDGVIRIWDTATGQTICDPWRGHDSWIRSVVFAPNGRCVVSGGFNCAVRVWDAFTGRPFREPFLGHTDSVSHVAFSSEGKCIISCSRDHTIRFWDASTKCPESDEGPEDDHAVLRRPHPVSFSPNRSHALADIQLIVPDAEEMSWFQVDDSFTLQGDGWLMGSDKRRLLWIPIQNRKLLWRSQNRRLVISPEEVTTLNLSNFAHGEKWAECFKQEAA